MFISSQTHNGYTFILISCAGKYHAQGTLPQDSKLLRSITNLLRCGRNGLRVVDDQTNLTVAVRADNLSTIVVGYPTGHAVAKSNRRTLERVLKGIGSGRVSLSSFDEILLDDVGNITTRVSPPTPGISAETEVVDEATAPEPIMVQPDPAVVEITTPAIVEIRTSRWAP